MLAKSTVDFTNRLPEVSRTIQKLAEEAVAEAARVGAEAASQRAAQRGMGDTIHPSSSLRTYDGFQASFVCVHPAVWWQNYGTLGSRRKRLKQPPRTDRTRAPGTGITPLRFLQAGRAAGRAHMIKRISAGLPR